MDQVISVVSIWKSYPTILDHFFLALILLSCILVEVLELLCAFAPLICKQEIECVWGGLFPVKCWVLSKNQPFIPSAPFPQIFGEEDSQPGCTGEEKWQHTLGLWNGNSPPPPTTLMVTGNLTSGSCLQFPNSSTSVCLNMLIFPLQMSTFAFLWASWP